MQESQLKNPGEHLEGQAPFLNEETIKKFISNSRPDLEPSDYNFSQLPFNPKIFESPRHLASGTFSHVFLLEAKDRSRPSYVIKIQHLGSKRKSDFKEADSIAEQTDLLRTEYKDTEKIKQIYSEIPEIVASESIVVIESPTGNLRQADVALIQKYYGPDMKDFLDTPIPELARLVAEDPELAATVNKFIDITLKHAKNNGEIIDFTGYENVALIKEDRRYRLMILDLHDIHTTDPSDPFYEEVEFWLQKLTEIKNALRKTIRKAA